MWAIYDMHVGHWSHTFSPEDPQGIFGDLKGIDGMSRNMFVQAIKTEQRQI